MKLRMLAVGTKMPAWVDEGVDTYRKRLPRDFTLDIEEIPLGQRGKNADVSKARLQESERIRAKLKGDEYLVALEVKGKTWSTPQLASEADKWRMLGKDVVLLVGGPDGLDPMLSAQADQTWSLSPLTLPHPLVRIMLAEQLYRAWTLLVGHPYHR